MKRQSYLTTRNRGGGLFSSFGKLFAAVLFFFVLLAVFLRFVAPGALTTLATPLWGIGTALSGRVEGAAPLTSRAALVRTNEQLAAEVAALKVERATLAAKAGDFERLLGGRTERAGGIVAGVMARPPVSPYDVLILDQGQEARIAYGHTVYGPGGVPLGTITETTARTSRATLYSSAGLVTEGWAGATRIPAKLIGTGAGGFDAEVPGTAGVAIGDQVFVPGPGALPIGSVVEIVTDPSSTSVVLRIRPLINPLSLTWVTVVPL
ncbi:MAG TPA: rod shape-determining protein MreC [Candidatus Paceibacterota bacterium]|jgi:cell shape-determining protein MreC